MSFELVSCPQIPKKLTEIVADNDAVILDVPGESVSGFATKLAMNLSAPVLIPMRTSTNDEASFGRNLWPVIQKSLQENHAAFAILPTFTHPKTNTENIRDYFKSIMPEQIGCLHNVLPFRSTFENFSREGMPLTEYATSVKGNSRLHAQAQKAQKDMEKLAREIIKESEKLNGRPSPRSGNTERFTLLISEETSERLTMAFATEQIRRRKKGEKVDKSLLIEEMIVEWLQKNKF